MAGFFKLLPVLCAQAWPPLPSSSHAAQQARQLLDLLLHLRPVLPSHPPGEMEFDCPHWSVFENALDMAHIHYVHDGSFGNADKPVINDMAVSRDTWSIIAEFR
jgi:hypothetical protein